MGVELQPHLVDQARLAASRRSIVLCTVSFEVDVPWLTPRSRRPELVLYDSLRR